MFNVSNGRNPESVLGSAIPRGLGGIIFRHRKLYISAAADECHDVKTP